MTILQRCAILAGMSLLSAAPGMAQHYQTDFPPAEFRARWERLFDAIGDDAVAVVQGVPLAKGFVMPRQTNAFYYLSGIETPHSYLLFDGRERTVTLYMPPRNERLERSEGKVLNASDAARVIELTGVDRVLSTDDMRADFPPGVRGSTTIYAMFTPAEGQGDGQSYDECMAAASSAQEKEACVQALDI